MWDNLRNFFSNYFSRLLVPKIHPLDFVEILLIAVIIYHLIKWIKRTRAWYLVKGIAILVAVWVVASILQFSAIQWIFVNTINVGIIAIFIIFQTGSRTARPEKAVRSLRGSVQYTRTVFR